MNRIIIACATLRTELRRAMEVCGCDIPVIWLTPGAHNVPQRRREEIRRALAKCEGYDTVLLCMTFCGNSLVGLNGGSHTLVLPRFDDCLSLLLGNRHRPIDTYYLNDGWLRGSDNLLTEYDTALTKYGEARADRIFTSMLHNYRRLVWFSDSPALPDRVREFASHFDLALASEMPTLDLLIKLLKGDWDSDFLVLPPDSQITLEMRNGGAVCV